MKDLEQLTIEYLAALVGLSTAELAELARKAPYLYREKRGTKKSGAVRIIEAPHDVLKERQRSILDGVLAGLPVDPMLHGGKGSSTVKAVLPHIRKPMVVTLDIQDFFPSVTSQMVSEMLRKRGASAEVTRLLTRLVTRERHLPQGAPTSPCVARLVLHPATKHIRRALQDVGDSAAASIYVDDITLSGPPGIRRLKNTIARIIERHGFRVHPDKVRIMPAGIDQETLGVRVNDGIAPTKAFLSKLKAETSRLGQGHPRVRGLGAHAKLLHRHGCRHGVPARPVAPTNGTCVQRKQETRTGGA